MERSFTSHRLQSAKPGPEATPRDEPTARPDGQAAGDKAVQDAKTEAPAAPKPKEIGGPSGPEPTRYGDWERNGICYDF